MKDDIRKTIASIFLKMVEEKLPFHGGVNGLVSDVNLLSIMKSQVQFF